MSVAEMPSIQTAASNGQGIVSALLTGTARLGSLAAAEPEDAAEALLSGEARDGAAIADFDRECLAELENFRKTILGLEGRKFDVALGRLVRLMAIVRRIRPLGTVVHFHKNYVAWNAFFENFVVDEGLDLRREYWRILALTQEIAAHAGLSGRRLMPMWQSICGECGGTGLYPQSYLRIALMGLRQLPLGDEFDANEDFALHGLARWAANRRPGKNEFMREWRLLEGDFPRTPDFWGSHVEKSINSMELEIYERTKKAQRTFDAASWWRADIGGVEAKQGLPRRELAPPPPELHETFLRRAGEPFGNINTLLGQLIRRHRQYADRSGDIFYLVRTACNVGMRLIEKSPIGEERARGESAIELARLAFIYDPTNIFAWALFRRAHLAMDRWVDAELIGWETIRRYPDDPNQRTQLATVLAERMGKPEEAAALLRETITLFPGDAYARNQLATVLAERMGMPEEAAALLRETITLFPGDAYARTQLATVLADDIHDIESARKVLKEAQVFGAANDVTRGLLAKLDQGRPLRGDRQNQRNRIVASLPGTLNLPGAVARRALFLFENGLASQDETRKIMEAQPPDPYVAYAALRAGSWQPPMKTSFYFAFEEAARSGSAAALRALISRARPLEQMLVNQAIAVIEQKPLPAANLPLNEGAELRLSNVVNLFAAKIAPATEKQLILLRDMSASLLSTSVTSLAA